MLLDEPHNPLFLPLALLPRSSVCQMLLFLGSLSLELRYNVGRSACVRCDMDFRDFVQRIV